MPPSLEDSARRRAAVGLAAIVLFACLQSPSASAQPTAPEALPAAESAAPAAEPARPPPSSNPPPAASPDSAGLPESSELVNEPPQPTTPQLTAPQPDALAAAVPDNRTAPAPKPRRSSKGRQPHAETDDAKFVGGSALRYALDGIRIVGNTRTSTKVIERFVPFSAGDILDVDDPKLKLTQYRLLGTGFFKDVTLSLERGKRRGHVVLVVTVVERNTLVLNDLWMGLAASADTEGDERFLSTFAGVDGAETNLFGSGITLGTATAFSKDQWALSVRFLDPSFVSSRWMLSSEVLYNNALGFFGNSAVRWDDPQQLTTVPRQAVVTYDRVGTTLGVGTDLSVPTTVWFNYRVESINAHVPNAASHEYGGQTEPIDFHVLPGRSLLSTLRATLTHDTRDEPWLTNTGWFATASADVSSFVLGSDYSFQKLDLQAARWLRLQNEHVLKLEASVGLISGRAPFFEQYYVGDLSDFRPGRVLGLAFDDRPAPNFLRTSIAEVRHGNYSSKINAEYRIPLYRGHRSVFGIDFFANFGVYFLANQRELQQPPQNRSGAATIPVDLTGGLGFRMDTNLGGFAFSFSNVLGFIPTGGEP